MIYFQSQVDKLMAEKDAQVVILKAENDRLRAQVDAQMQRAENAIDQLLQLAGSAPVTPAPKEEPEDEMPGIMAAVGSIGRDALERDDDR